MKLQQSTGNFTPAPEGTTQAVLCDIIDLGLLEDKFNPGQMVHRMQFRFQTEETTPEGVPFAVSTFPLTASINSKANAYKIVKALLGRDLEKADFDEKGNVDLDGLLIGKNAMITIEHNVKGERTYANIADVSPVPTKIKDVVEIRDYVRVQDREEEVSYSGDTDEEVEAEIAKVATATGGKTKSAKDLNF